MQTIFNSSQELVQLSTSVLNDIDTKYGEISNANATTITTARKVLSNVEGTVGSLQAKATTAAYKSSNATTNTKATKARIDAVLKKFSDISEVDSTHILELSQLVQQARQDFDDRDLESIVTKYRDAVKANADKIANMQQRVKTLQDQNARLSTVAAQLRVGKK